MADIGDKNKEWQREYWPLENPVPQREAQPEVLPKKVVIPKREKTKEPVPLD
jgi:hypothetical protein